MTRDRVVELRRVPAADLRANPRNWRRHPPAQQQALRSLLDRVGIAGAVLARETPEGLELIDGHLRQELLAAESVPVLVVDVDQEEADLLLATLDPIAALADTDPDALFALLEDVEIPSEDLSRFLNDLADAPTVESDYTKRIDLPHYEIVGEEPLVTDLYDETKTAELRAGIGSVELPDDVRAFLEAAAARHTVFDYRKIAEFYPHASPEVQALIEASALVIIDVDDAIANGFATFSATVAELLGDEIEDHGVGLRPGGTSGPRMRIA